jgi:Domain of unknown function (DUF4262)
MPFRWGLNRIERDILDNIDKHGRFCMSVFDEEGGAPPFAYSIGFTKTLSCPEFIIFGLNQKTSHAILWNTFHAIQQGKTPTDGQRWEELAQGFECIIRSVHPTNIVREYLNSAIWFWGDPKQRGKSLEAFQIVWPDASGLFPWEEGCNAGDRDCQAPLYLPKRAL